MLYIVHIYARDSDRDDLPAAPACPFVGEFSREADAAAAARIYYPYVFAGPPMHDPQGGGYLLLFRDHRLLAPEGGDNIRALVEMMDMPVGRVLAVRQGLAETLAADLVPFDIHQWLPEHLCDDLAALLGAAVDVGLEPLRLHDAAVDETTS